MITITSHKNYSQLWITKKWDNCRNDFTNMNHKKIIKLDFQNVKKWNPQKMVEKWYTKRTHKNHLQELSTKIIHKKDSQKIIHKNDTQKWFTKVVHKSDS